jgi:prolyl-tRNA synthetase
MARCDLKTKEIPPFDGLTERIAALLEEIRQTICQKALAFRAANTFVIDTYDEFKAQIKKGGFIMAHWDGTSDTEEAINEQTKATIRCIPFEGANNPGTCVYSGKPSVQRMVFARAY